MNNAQQHFLRTFGPHENLFARLGVQGREVIEVGIGHGELTRLLLSAGVERIIGFEIDEALASPVWEDPRVEVYVLDFLAFEQAQPTFESWPALVANPPYDMLDEVFAFIDEYAIDDVILMVPSHYQLPDGYTFAFALGGDAFDPPFQGQHHVVFSGWGSKSRSSA